MSEKRIEDDFKRAEDVYQRIRKEVGDDRIVPSTLFALCLIYVRQLKHHTCEEAKLSEGYGEP